MVLWFLVRQCDVDEKCPYFQNKEVLQMSSERHVTIRFNKETVSKKCFCDVCKASKQPVVTRLMPGEEFFGMKVKRIDYKLIRGNMRPMALGKHGSNKRKVCKKCFGKIHSFMSPEPLSAITVGSEYISLEKKVRLEIQTAMEDGPCCCMCGCGKTIEPGKEYVRENGRGLICMEYCFSTVAVVIGKI